MSNPGDRCYNCRHQICLCGKYYCILARNEIEFDELAEFCDFYKEDPYELLHDHAAMERDIKEDAADLHHKE